MAAFHERADRLWLVAGVGVPDDRRELPLARRIRAGFYRWKKRFGAMGVAEVRRLRQLDDKNAKLKRMVAGLSVDRSSLRDVLRKKPDAQPAPRTGLIRARCLAGEGAPELGLAADIRTAPTRWLAGQLNAHGASVSHWKVLIAVELGDAARFCGDSRSNARPGAPGRALEHGIHVRLAVETDRKPLLSKIDIGTEFVS
jgi:putative transposase